MKGLPMLKELPIFLKKQKSSLKSGELEKKKV
jgi:hypothetical protein